MTFMIKIYVSSEGKRVNAESKPRSSLANHTKLSQRLEVCLLVLFSALTSIMFQNSYLKSLHPTWGIFCFRRSHTLSGSARKALSCLHGGLFEVKTPWRELFVITRCWIDVSFQNDLFTWPPAVRFSDGLSGSARNTSNVFECRNKGNATTTINKYGHSFRHLSCYVRLHFLNSPLLHNKYSGIFYSVFVKNERELWVILSWLWRFPSSVCFCEVRLLSVLVPWNANPFKLCISKIWRADILQSCGKYSVFSYCGFGQTIFPLWLEHKKSHCACMWISWFVFVNVLCWCHNNYVYIQYL